VTGNWVALVMIIVALFLAGGVFSFVRQGLRAGAVVLGVAAALAATAGVMWW
jgi:hypothetical protein